MAKYEFSVRYAGEALSDGRIPIKELAPSLLSLSEAFQEMQQIIYPEQKSISLDIKATENGSFIVDLILANGHDILNQALELFTGKEAEAMKSLIEISGGVIGAFTFITHVYNKKIKKKEDINDNQVKITLDDETHFSIPKSSFEACQTINFRKNVQSFVKPLETEGVQSIEFSNTKEISLSITKEDIPSFVMPPIVDKELDVTETETYLQIINVAFEHGKWKFSDGNKIFFAKIEDEPFLDSVKKNKQQFGSTDLLKVVLQTTQSITKDGLKSEYAIKSILEHQKGAQQIELDIEQK